MFNKDGGKVRRQFQPLVEKINGLEPQMQSLSDEQLRSKTAEFKQRHQDGESLDDLLVESFAVRSPILMHDFINCMLHLITVLEGVHACIHISFAHNSFSSKQVESCIPARKAKPMKSSCIM